MSNNGTDQSHARPTVCPDPVAALAAVDQGNTATDEAGIYWLGVNLVA